MPFYPSGETEGLAYYIDSFYEHMVRDYTGLSFREIDQLLYIEFLQYRRDAYIYQLSQTESGREYLQKCALYEKTEPDRQSLWRLKMKGVE